MKIIKVLGCILGFVLKMIGELFKGVLFIGVITGLSGFFGPKE